MTPRILLLTAVAVPLLVGTASARMWYVAADGSGDAPTIAAAVDSSASGDVILAGPGTHFVVNIYGGAVDLKPGTSLISEVGPTGTFLKSGNPPSQPGLVSAHGGCVVSGFNMHGGLAATVFVIGDYVEITNNIVDSSPSGTAAIAVLGSYASVHNNICFGGNASISLATVSADIYNNIILNGIENDGFCPLDVRIHCNLINGSMSACPFRFNNFGGDPLFCGQDNYYLHSDSPCAPGNHPDGVDCGLIGPLPVGCGAVSVETKTWGGVKAIYRD